MQTNQLAINTISLRGELLAILDACAEAGFHNIEFALPQIKPFVQEQGVDALKRELSARELTCIGGFESTLLVVEDAVTNATSETLLVENAYLLHQLGATNLVCGTDGKPLAAIPDGIALYGTALKRVGEQLAPLGVNLLLEFNWGGVKTFRAAVELARVSGLANVGVLFDPAHFYCTPTKSEDLTPENVAFVKHVHVDNMRPLPPDLSNCNSDRLLPDDPNGVLDLKSLFGRLEAGGYTGLFSIEMFSGELWGLPPQAAAKRMYESLLGLCGQASAAH